MRNQEISQIVDKFEEITLAAFKLAEVPQDGALRLAMSVGIAKIFKGEVRRLRNRLVLANLAEAPGNMAEMDDVARLAADVAARQVRRYWPGPDDIPEPLEADDLAGAITDALARKYGPARMASDVMTDGRGGTPFLP